MCWNHTSKLSGWHGFKRLVGPVWGGGAGARHTARVLSVNLRLWDSFASQNLEIQWGSFRCETGTAWGEMVKSCHSCDVHDYIEVIHDGSRGNRMYRKVRLENIHVWCHDYCIQVVGEKEISLLELFSKKPRNAQKTENQCVQHCSVGLGPAGGDPASAWDAVHVSVQKFIAAIRDFTRL